jgi:hypothetical protein
MTDFDLSDSWRLLYASFQDTPEGARWRQRLGASADEVRELMVHVFGRDLCQPPDTLDREQIGALLTQILPGRLQGQEPYRTDLVDLIEEFLLHVTREVGLSSAWEWSSAVDQHRAGYEAALKNPGRAAVGTSPRRTPDRRAAPKLGRNDPCFCGSAKKYKHCCGKPQ